MPHRKAARAVWHNLAVISLIVAAVVASLGWAANGARIDDNRRIITNLQASRIESCRRTYEGVREVFKPFFLPPSKRTAEQRRDIRKFNQTVDRLKRRCARQTGVRRVDP